MQSVELGGTNTGLGGAVLFPNGTPQVAELDAMDMGILDVLSRVLQFEDSGAAGSWPSAYDPFTIKSEVIYYNNGAAVTTPTFTYNRGYNIFAKLEALFGVTFSLSISIPGRSGVIIAGTYVGTIDFDFIKLGSFPLQPSGNSLGPMLSIDTAQQR